MLKRLKSALKVLLQGDQQVVLFNDPSIINKITQTEQQVFAEQTKPLHDMIYLLAGKISEMSENLVQLTTAIEVLQNEMDNTSPANTTKTVKQQNPKIDMLLKVGEAWDKSNKVKKGVLQ